MLKRQNNINYFLTDFNRVNFTDKFARIFARMFCARLNKNVTQKKRLHKKCARKKHAKTLVKSTLGLSFNYLFALSTKFL